MMTEDVILKCAGGPASLASVTYLNLHGNAIRKIEGLAACPNLKVRRCRLKPAETRAESALVS